MRRSFAGLVVCVLAAGGALGALPVDPATQLKHANVTLDTFDNDPDFKPTLITINARNTPALGVLAQIEQQAQCKFTLSTQVSPFITLSLRDVPMMDALYRVALAGRYGLATRTVPTPAGSTGQNIQPLFDGQPASVWSVTGPFVLAVTDITHTVSLGAGAEEQMHIAFHMEFEPRIHMARGPEHLRLTEAVDEKGHSLVPAPGAVPAPQPPLTQAVYERQSLLISAGLVYPAEDPGRRIAHLKGVVTCTVLTKSENLEVDLKAFTEPFVKEVGGVEVTISPPTPGTSGRMVYAVQYRRTTFPADGWRDQALALGGAEPVLQKANGEHSFINGQVMSIKGDVVTRKFDTSPVGSSQAAPVPPVTLTLQVPVTLRKVDVPFEFNDLPLP